ncbi:hypothetical protein KR054_012278 [Drosophila jambulina]|nr:hypothetical protein KR054_012278 [Drosophila jambulina]
MSCRAPGLSQNESEIELTSSLDDMQEGSELDLEEAYQQLERMKQRVLQMKSKIIRNVATEPSPEQVPSDSDNVHLREIQLETSRGFQQIEAVKSRLKETTDELGVLGARIQESVRCTEKLSQQLDEVPKWMEQHKLQVGVCLERYNELDTSYCTDFDYSSHMRPLLVRLMNQYGSRVPLKCYQIEYKAVSGRLGRTRRMLNRTRELLMHTMRKIEEALLAPDQLPFLMVLPEMLKAEEEHFNEQEDPALTELPAEEQVEFEAIPATISHQIPAQ